jgi:hypothetical protein
MAKQGRRRDEREGRVGPVRKRGKGEEASRGRWRLGGARERRACTDDECWAPSGP